MKVLAIQVDVTGMGEDDLTLLKSFMEELADNYQCPILNSGVREIEVNEEEDEDATDLH